MILATADSNIYISALQFGGIPLQFLNAARSGAFQLCISESIIIEIRGVLNQKFYWPEEMIDEAVFWVRSFSRVFVPTETLRVVINDPDDDRVIECAVASASQFIVSGDKHLLGLIQYESIRIVKVSDFLGLIPKPSD